MTRSTYFLTPPAAAVVFFDACLVESCLRGALLWKKSVVESRGVASSTSRVPSSRLAGGLLEDKQGESATRATTSNVHEVLTLVRAIGEEVERWLEDEVK